jgi:collagen type VII alpha
MTFEPEILFIDPAVSDVRAILAGLRPGVQPVLLDAARPAAVQMVAALAGRRNLAAVHVIAHGAPGRVGFAAGEWSLETLARDAGDVAAIGRALAEDGDLRLWSCETGRGTAGQAFVEALSEAAGADVSAATSLVGAAALGGRWDLAVSVGARAAPPLTDAGVASYAAVLSLEVTLTGSLDPAASVNGTGFPVQYYITNSSGVIVDSF